MSLFSNMMIGMLLILQNGFEVEETVKKRVRHVALLLKMFDRTVAMKFLYVVLILGLFSHHFIFLASLNFLKEKKVWWMMDNVSSVVWMLGIGKMYMLLL
jgi:hypothetical protein